MNKNQINNIIQSAKNNNKNSIIILQKISNEILNQLKKENYIIEEKKEYTIIKWQ